MCARLCNSLRESSQPNSLPTSYSLGFQRITNRMACGGKEHGVARELLRMPCKSLLGHPSSKFP